MSKVYVKGTFRYFCMCNLKSEAMFSILISLSLVLLYMEPIRSFINWLEHPFSGILWESLEFWSNTSRNRESKILTELTYKFCFLQFQRLEISLRTIQNGLESTKNLSKKYSKLCSMKIYAVWVQAFLKNLFKLNKSTLKSLLHQEVNLQDC